MALTGTAIRKAKPVDKPQKLADGGGMYLLLNPNSSRWWICPRVRSADGWTIIPAGAG